MGFKLVRVDAPEPAKIPLNAGTQIIGRGSFPDCDDNRMSRKHALVVVTGETVTLKSLHQNPCFYSISKAHQTVMLPQGKTVSLKSGDHFGLLPERNWYELIFYKESSEFTNPSSMAEENKISLSESFMGTFSTQYGNKQVSGVTENTDSKNNEKSTRSYKNKKDDEDTDSGSSTLNLEVERGEESTQVAESQPSSSYFNAHNQVPNDPNTSPNELGQTGPDETSSGVQSSPGKRSHSPDRIPDAKKVKTEPESPKAEGSQDPEEKAQDPEEKPQSTEKTNVQVHDAYTTIEPLIAMDIEPQDAKIVETEPNDPNNVNTEPENANNANTEHPNDANINYLDPQTQGNADDENKEPQDPTDKNTVPNNDNTKPQNPIDMNKEPQDPKDMNTESQNPINKDNDTDSLCPNDTNTESQESTDGDTEAQSPKDVKDVKKDPDEPKPGPSQAQPGSSKDGDAAPPNPQACPARERCMYGANCYRKNPQHKIQFSHPGEADYGEGAKGRCPYGADCRRRDVRHWSHHEHPPGVAPPVVNLDPNNRGIRVVQRRGQIFYINAHSVHFHDDYYELEYQDGDRVDYDYEF